MKMYKKKKQQQLKTYHKHWKQWRQKSFQRLDDEVKINSQHYYKINKQPSTKK
jgi:hypothetical protein